MKLLFNDVLRRGRENFPDRVAVTAADGNISYYDLDVLSNGIASLLLSKGARPKDRIALCMSNSSLWIYAFFGIIKAGCTAVLINSYAEQKDKKELASFSRCRFYLCKTGDSLELSGTEAIELDIGISPLESFDSRPLKEKQTAVIIFTSGTTTSPKGVCLSQRALLCNAKALTRSFGKYHGEKICLALPLFHSFGLQVALSYLYMGETVCLPEKINGDCIGRLLKKEKITDITGVPTVFEGLKNTLSNDVAKSLGFCIVGGSNVGEELTKKLRGKFSNAQILVGYGLSENSPVVSCLAAKDRHLDSVGKPIKGVGVKIKNGEITVFGKCVMNGYLQKDGSISPPAKGVVLTGDLGHFSPDKYLYIDGRIKQIIIKGGENISAEKIEKAALYCGACEAAAVAIPDEIFGENIALFAVKEGQNDFDTRQFENELSKVLSRFEMPKIILPLAQIPKTPSGKTDTEKLRKILKDK